MSRRRTVRALCILLATAGIWYVASALFIPAKALVAQILLHRAWEKTLAGGEQVRPWPWADTWPVARLRLPDHGADLIVLSGASGQTLAFGPGHVIGTAQPGTKGVSVIGGHRDTHLKILASLRPGDSVEIQRSDGYTRYYQVVGLTLADVRKQWVAPQNSDGVVLVTCYPFDAVVPGGSLRFLAHAYPIDSPTGITASPAPY